MATASKQRAVGLHSGKKSERAAILKGASTAKTTFVTEGLYFIQHVLGEILRQSQLKTEIFKGLAAFDPFIFFKRPTESFDVLYPTFTLRSWVTPENELVCREEYLSLLDFLRSTYSSDFDITGVSRDLIKFLIAQDFMQTRTHLLCLFKLCCLCVKSSSP